MTSALGNVVLAMQSERIGFDKPMFSKMVESDTRRIMGIVQRIGRNGICDIPECRHCGCKARGKRQIKRIVTDETLISYICGRCNRRFEKANVAIQHKMRLDRIG